jgi:hypothetical protein
VDRIAEIQRALGDDIAVVRLLGTGGFAEVFEATDARLGRSLAVKVMRADVAAPRARDRFLREARAAAQVRHPNVLAVFDVGQQGEIVWFTMPLVSGDSLRARLDREKRIEPDEATRILLASAAGLHAAHRAGLVHRDVKPDNILIDGPDRHILIADFGVAAAATGDSDRITTEGAVIGTPRYMSPEQAAGESVVDARADVYALGVVGYEMIAGEPPFTAANAGALLAKHLTAPVPPLRSKSADCPTTLANAIERALEKDPADRWPTAEAFRLALEGRPSSRLSSPVVDPGAPVSRAVGMVPIVVALLAIGAAALVDSFTGTMLFSPLVGAAALIAFGLRYGAARAEAAQRPSHDRSAATARRVRRARALRTASRALLASMPKAERSRFGSLDLALDQLLFAAEQSVNAPGATHDADRVVIALTELHTAIEGAATDATAAADRVRQLVAEYAPTRP